MSEYQRKRDIIRRAVEHMRANPPPGDRLVYDEELAAILAELREPAQPAGDAVQGPYLPMETAPKNGAGILALLPDSNFPVGIRYHDGAWHVAWDNSRLGEFDQPVKWMYIPEDRDAALAAPVQPVVDEREYIRSLESLVAACEKAFTDPDLDHPDDADDDVSIPGIGITYRQIWLARDALNRLTAQPGEGVG